MQNENNLDRGIRVALGIVFLLLGFYTFTGTLQTVSYVLGFLGVFTGLSGFCLLYKFFGINTKK